MESPTLEIEGTWDEIMAQAERFACRRFRLIVLPEEAQGSPRSDREHSLEEKIAEIVAEVPEEERAKLPADLGDQLDHHIYDTPAAARMSSTS